MINTDFITHYYMEILSFGLLVYSYIYCLWVVIRHCLVLSYGTSKYPAAYILTTGHFIRHILLIVSILITNFIGIYWLFSHKGFEHGLNVHVLGEELWWIMTPLAITVYSTVAHINAEITLNKSEYRV